MQFVYQEYNWWQDAGFGFEKSTGKQGKRLEVVATVQVTGNEVQN